MNMLKENAKKAIRLGINDYYSSEQDREISSIRNIYAGLLLIFKDKLLRLSPLGSNEVLIKQVIQPQIDGSVIKFVGVGKKTVDFTQIKDRFKTLNIKADWKILGDIQNERNNIEHYYSSTSKELFRKLIVLSFLVMQDFIKDELEEDPSDYIGVDSWKKLLEIKDVYDKERKECDEIIEIVIDNEHIKNVIRNMTCDKCGSDLIEPEKDKNDYKLTCKTCKRTFFYKDTMIERVRKEYSYADYRRFKETLEHEIVTCPSCGNDSFSISEDKCVICGYEKAYSNCTRCGEKLSVEEQVLDGLCSSCMYEYEKTMEDD